MTSPRRPPALLRTTSAAWMFAVLVFAAVIVIVAQRSEIEEVISLIRRVQAKWLVAAFVLQTLSYVMAAAVWRLGLMANGHHQPMRSLMALALAMLVSNQAVPSVGVSGSLVVVGALVRRGVPGPVAMSALILGLTTTYAAFLAALAVASVTVRAPHSVMAVMAVAAVAFGLMAGAVTYAVFQFRRLPAALQDRVSRLPVVGRSLRAIGSAPIVSLRQPVLILKATLLQLAEIAIDASTLGVVLFALGYRLTPGAVFGAYVMASVASRVSLAPLGIGTFEAGLVTLLHAARIPLGPALTATLIFRGFTLWQPMLPGLWCARHMLRAR